MNTLPDPRAQFHSSHRASRRPPTGVNRRGFLLRSAAALGGCAACAGRFPLFAGECPLKGSPLVSPGCRRSKVRVARLYLGKPDAHWPTPRLDLAAERHSYDAAFASLREEFADVEFVVDELVTDASQVAGLADRLKSADGVLLIHLSMGMKGVIEAVLALDRPTALFAAPYSGHEWSQLGALRQQPAGAHFECFLTSDRSQLAAAVRPFRAIHHLREAKILNVTERAPDEARLQAWQSRFGTEFRTVGLQRMLAAYEAVPLTDAEAEAERWISQAMELREPSRDEVIRSCRLALAFENLLAEEEATVITVDCYGSMYRKLPAFPCVGFVRLNDLGLGGICESDLTSAMTYIILQGLSGRPGFISDPTVDEAENSIILAHCLGTRKMDGPEGQAAPYRLRTIMERQEGCVPQVFMRRGQKVTQAFLATPEKLLYFTGDVISVPDSERGCRTQIQVRVDGSIAKIWQNWGHGLHRLTAYGDLTADLARFCRYKDVAFVNEA